MTLRLLLLIIISSFFFSCMSTKNIDTTKGYQLNEADLAEQGYTQMFEENFNDGFDNWRIWHGGAYNNELQFYTPASLTTANGVLTIRPQRKKITGPILPGNTELSDYRFTSGRIESLFEIAPMHPDEKIRICARIMLPKGYGLWPAFWMYGNTSGEHREIDIMESTGEGDSYIANYHYINFAENTPANDDITATHVPSAALAEGFHVYEVIWAKDSLTFLLDGIIVVEKRTSEAGQEYIAQLFGHPQRLVLNLAIGGNMFPDLKRSKIRLQPMHVDWVKVYHNKF